MNKPSYNGTGALLSWNDIIPTENLRCTKDSTLDQEERTKRLNQFFIDIEKRVFRMAQIALGSVDDALDVVQDSMLKFVDHYFHKPENEWTPLFYRIVQNQIRDVQRKRTTRGKWMFWQKSKQDDESEVNIVEESPGREQDEPLKRLISDSAIDQLMEALSELPFRQQQAFLLRIWEGLDVAQTAKAMSCSQGSVKTHLSRAMAALRGKLENHWS